MLLKTNRPPTDDERAIILEFMDPVNAELKILEAQIFAADAQVNVLQSQLKRAQNELLRLRKKEASILETFADIRGTLSSFRSMPEDVLREICLAFVAANVPVLSYPFVPSYTSPYELMRISSGLRRIVLETPSIWASVNLDISSSDRMNKLQYTTLVFEARKWLERASGLVSICVEDFTPQPDANLEVDPANILFDFLISHSARWKSLEIKCSTLPTLVTCIAALSAVDVPQLRSVSLHFESDTSIFSESTFLSAPRLEHLKLATSWDHMSGFTINWPLLTSLTLHGCFAGFGQNLSFGKIVEILHQTKCLSFCDITVDYDEDLAIDLNFSTKINLPFLKTLQLVDESRPSAHPGILDLINAPNLQIFELWGQFFEASASMFFKRSPNIQELFLYQLFDEESLMDVMELLHHCPSLIVLFLQRIQELPRLMPDTLDANRFLRIFVQEDDRVICPRLEYFTFEGPINMSVQTLRQFLEGKQRRIAKPNSLCPWRTVAIDLRGIVDTHVQEQMLNVISEKRKEGLLISISRKELHYIG